MNQTSIKQPSFSRVAGPQLGLTAFRGFTWMVAITIVGKGASTFAQIALAWLLLPKAFGVVGLSYTVYAVASLFQQMGFREILIQRGDRFQLWVSPVFWMSLAAGICGAFMLAFAAPVAARLYSAPIVARLVLILALVPPLNALAVVPTAYLQYHLRFRTVAAVNAVEAIGIPVLSILFAFFGMGAYSFVLPRPIIAAAQAGLLWSSVRAPLGLRLQLKRWRFIVGDAGAVSVTSLALICIAQGDYAALGLFRPAEIVGFYYFAFNLSTQTIQLLLLNVINVLVSAFAKLNNDPARQAAALLRVTRILACLAVPLCFLQAALAGPGFNLVFSPKWRPSVVLVEILSIAMAMNLVAGPAYAMIKSQGRFVAYRNLTLFAAPPFLVAVLAASYFGGPIYVAFAVLGFHLVFAPAQVYLVLPQRPNRFRDVLSCFMVPCLASAFCTAAALLVVRYMPAVRSSNLKTLIVTGLVDVTLYCVIVRALIPDVWHDLVGRVKSLRP